MNSKRPKAPDTDTDMFIKVWNESKTVKEVADKLGVTYGSARTIAWNMRKKGYKLMKMKDQR